MTNEEKLVADLVRDNPTDFAASFSLPTNEPVRLLGSAASMLAEMPPPDDVAVVFGDPANDVVDFFFASEYDAWLPNKLLMHSATLHLRFGTGVRSIVVLLRPDADGPKLTGVLSHGERGSGHYLRFPYQVIRAWERPMTALRKGMAAWMVFDSFRQSESALADVLVEIVREIDREDGDQFEFSGPTRLATAREHDGDTANAIANGMQMMERAARQLVAAKT